MSLIFGNTVDVVSSVVDVIGVGAVDATNVDVSVADISARLQREVMITGNLSIQTRRPIDVLTAFCCVAPIDSFRSDPSEVE